MGSWQWKTSIFQRPCFSQCFTTLLMYCLSISKHFWDTKWYKHMRLTTGTFEHMGYWGEYCVHSNFLAIPSLLYHPRRLVLAERFNTRWVFLALEMNASWNSWVWDGNLQHRYKSSQDSLVLVFTNLHEDVNKTISSSSTFLPKIVNLLGNVDGSGGLAFTKTP